MSYTEAEAEALIWACQTQSLAQQPLVDPTTWSGAVQLDVLNPTDVSPAPLRRGEADLTIAVVMMVKDEADIIGQNLYWLYFVGVRRFVIIDNESTDGTSDILTAFRQSHVDIEMVVIFDPIVRLIQSEKTTGAFQFAINIWPSCAWVFPIDADEFLIPQRGFQPLHELGAEFDGIIIPKVNHFVLRDGAAGSTGGKSLFGRMPLRTGKWALPPKIALRANAAYRIGQGNHQIHRIDGVASRYAHAGAADMFYREYQVRDYQHFRTKVINGGKAIRELVAATGQPLGGAHWLNWHELYLAGGEDALHAVFERDFQRTIGDGLVLDPFEPS